MKQVSPNDSIKEVTGYRIEDSVSIPEGRRTLEVLLKARQISVMQQIFFERRPIVYQRSRVIKPTKFRRPDLLFSSAGEGQEEKITLSGLLVGRALEKSFY
jgi:hypothetical protein